MCLNNPTGTFSSSSLLPSLNLFLPPPCSLLFPHHLFCPIPSFHSLFSSLSHSPSLRSPAPIPTPLHGSLAPFLLFVTFLLRHTHTLTLSLFNLITRGYYLFSLLPILSLDPLDNSISQLGLASVLTSKPVLL